jgi:hypothetical protein
LKRLSLRILFPILAAVLFAMLSFARARQNHVFDARGWGHSSDTELFSGEESDDIGTPADVVLLAFNLPALIALLSLSPLACWVDSEIALRTAWGLAAVGQWFLVGCFFDTRRGLLRAGEPSRRVLLNKVLFVIAMVAGGLAAGAGLFGAARGHHSLWGEAMDASFVFWGLVFVIVALRWRSSSSWAREHFNSFRLS